jgi:hypothetical protein
MQPFRPCSAAAALGLLLLATCTHAGSSVTVPSSLCGVYIALDNATTYITEIHVGTTEVAWWTQFDSGPPGAPRGLGAYDYANANSTFSVACFTATAYGGFIDRLGGRFVLGPVNASTHVVHISAEDREGQYLTCDAALPDSGGHRYVRTSTACSRAGAGELAAGAAVTIVLAVLALAVVRAE